MSGTGIIQGHGRLTAGAKSHVGNVRPHNEDAHAVQTAAGRFLVCDGMGGHAAGEIASALAVDVVSRRWADLDAAVAAWGDGSASGPRRALFRGLRAGVLAAHEQIVADSLADLRKRGMGTTFVGLQIAGSHGIVCHAGDSRAYLVRDGHAEQLTEDHTLLARLAAAGVDVAAVGDNSRWRGVLTNALGIGEYTRVAMLAVPLATGDRFLLCSDGISEYVSLDEVAAVLSAQASPARAADQLVQIALDRGGGDNATAVVVHVAAGGPHSAAQRRRDDQVLARCRLLERLSPGQRLRALRIAVERSFAAGEVLPATTADDRLAWLVLDGEVERGGAVVRGGAVLYPESLLVDRPALDAKSQGTARSAVRALAIGRDDFGEITVDEPDLAEPLFQALADILKPPT
jgi:serine/threonine protein phosphatase PrpC